MDNLVEKWYVLHTSAGHEYRVQNLLNERLVNLGVKDYVTEVLVPDEEKIEIKGTKRKIVKRKALPGYVLVRIKVEPYETKSGTEYKMDNKVWYIVKNTDSVSGFVGAVKNPIPIDDHEVEAIQSKMKRYTEPQLEECTFIVGEKIEITAGSFMGSVGKIEEIDEKSRKLVVMVEIFNRLTPVEINFDEVKLI